ncbi:MAG: flagellar M-ring protein FliF [Campylobacterales bacterium]|nr:flagellar M-ring protein FliF [Campylobacterales bacterium]
MDFKALFQQLTLIIQKLNKKQKIIILASLVSVVAFIAFLIVYNNNQKVVDDGYKVLFDNLSPKDAALIVQNLEQNKIPYKLPKDSTILVPEEQVYKQRINIASLGIPKDSRVGFELFDKQEFGATDFDQNVKFLRALEGELSKTIESLTPIEKAVVHIAIPKESVFVAKDIPPSASVAVTLKKNMILTHGQVKGVKNLVSASIAKMTPENVKIVDENGEPLDEKDEYVQTKELAKAQLRYKNELEKLYEEKIVNILAPFIGGVDSVVAKVSIEFDFSQKDSTEESFAPDNIVRSEQIEEEKREGYRKDKQIGGVPGAVSNIGPVEGLEDDTFREKYQKNKNTVNYEISKVVSSVKGEFAKVKRVSAAVVCDGKYVENIAENGVKTVEYKSLDATELESISNIVKRTVGFNVDRNDEVTVSNFQFHPERTSTKELAGLDKFANDLKMGQYEPFMPLIRYLIAGIILFIFYKKVIVPFAERMMELKVEDEDEQPKLLELDEGQEEDALEKFKDMKKRVEEQLGIQGNFDEEQVKYEVLLEKLKNLVEEHPEEISSLLQALVKDEEGNIDLGHKRD